MFSRPKTKIISDPKVIAVLSNKKSILMLQAFSLTPVSMKQAAQKLHISLSNCHYWVKKFLKLGVLKLAYSKKRAGSTINYYWMIADTLVSSLGKNPELLENYYETLTNIYGGLTVQGAIASLRELDLDLSVRIGANSQGYLYYDLINTVEGVERPLLAKMLDPDSPAAILRWGSIELAFADAKNFQRELNDVLVKYANKTVKGQKGYFYQITLVPEVN